MSSNCRSCGAPVIWVLTDKGKRMPLDFEPEQLRGRFTVEGSFEEAPVARSVGAVYTSHFATCPNASVHRRPRD